MKKITLLLSLLCVMCFSATAQTNPTDDDLLTSLENVSDDGWFLLYSNGKQGQNKYVADQFKTTEKVTLVSSYAGLGNESVRCLWRLVSTGTTGQYKVQNAATGRYIPAFTGNTGAFSTVDEASAGTYEVKATSSDGTWVFKNPANNIYIDNNGSNPVPWGSNDDPTNEQKNSWYKVYSTTQTNTDVLNSLKAIAEAYTTVGSKSDVPGYATETELASLTAAVATNTLDALRSAMNSFTFSMVYPTGKYFVIDNNNANRGAIIYHPDASANVDAEHDNAEYIWTTGKASTTLDATDKNHLWALYQNPVNNEYYLYNVGKKMFANPNGKGAGTDAYGSDGDTWIFSNTPVAVTMTAMAYPKVRIFGGNKALAVSNNYVGPVINYNDANDGGVPFLFGESTVAVDEDVTSTIKGFVDFYNANNALTAAINAAKTYDGKIGTAVCEYSQPEGAEAIATVIAEAENLLASEERATATMDAMATRLNGLVAGLEINKPVTGKFYRFKDSKTGNRRMTSTPDGNKLKMEKTGKNITSTVFYVDGSHLVAFSNGYYMGNFDKDDQNGAWKCLLPNAAKVGTVEFKGSATLGKLNVVMKGSGQDRYLFNQHDQVNCGSSDGGEGYRWYAEEVEWLPVPFSADVDYATLISPVTLSRFAADGTTERVKAYTGKIEGNYVVLTEISGKFIPANVPVILEKKNGFEDNSIYLKVVSDAASSDAEQSLTGNFFAQSSTEADGHCTLQLVEGTTGFYTYTGDVLYGFKAYIAGAAAQGVRGFAFQTPGDATGISGVTAGTEGEEIFYDLNGRRVLYPANGIYVTASGKKVLVK